MKKLVVFILVACLVLLSACSGKNVSSDKQQNVSNIEGSYRKISAEKARQMMSESNNYILLDVRTDEEYKEKRIEGAILIPDSELKNRAEKQLTDKDALIFVYCRSGRRSENAAKILINKNYTNIYDLGGIVDWPYDTVSGK